MQAIINFILDLFKGLESVKYGKEILVFIISIMPVLELRGGILASSLLGIKPLTGYIISIIGNFIPIPFILLFINKILELMSKSKIKWINNIAKWLNNKVDKNKSQIVKYGYIGLLLFVGIPLPGTGAWTGCLIASVLGLDRKKSFIYISCGIILASIIMMILSYGILDNLI